MEKVSEADRAYYFTLLLALAILIGVLKLGLLPALLGGLLVYFLVEFGAKRLGRLGVMASSGRLILLAAVILISVLVIALLIAMSIPYISDGPESFGMLFQRVADIVERARSYLPLWMQEYLPDSIAEFQETASAWLRRNAWHFSMFGKEIGIFLFHVIAGMVIGGMIALRPGFQESKGRPLAQELRQRVLFLSASFRRIVFSQIRISALNTLLTGFFLAVILPMTGNPLPLTKTMIAITFIVGLLPIVGNLISNTVIFLIALSVSPMAAVGALTFLVVIHKLEYFVNAHIIGTQIRARAWELLLAMLVMETLFGLAGLVAAPIYYAYLKDELTARRLV